MNRNTMAKSLALAGTEAECFVTINGKRKQFASIFQFKAEIKISLKEVPILGRRFVANKAGKMSGTFSGKAHFNNSVFRNVIADFKKTGKMPDIDIQVTNEDETSTVGRQTVILRECLFDGMVLTQFDESAEFLEEEIKGVFGDFELPEKFKEMGDMF